VSLFTPPTVVLSHRCKHINKIHQHLHSRQTSCLAPFSDSKLSITSRHFGYASVLCTSKFAVMVKCECRSVSCTNGSMLIIQDHILVQSDIIELPYMNPAVVLAKYSGAHLGNHCLVRLPQLRRSVAHLVGDVRSFCLSRNHTFYYSRWLIHVWRSDHDDIVAMISTS
jgi:hypothetical protein